MKRTPIFPPEIKPARVGLYEVENQFWPGEFLMAFWNGDEWLNRDFGVRMSRMRTQDRHWRGLANKPKGAK